MLLAPSSLSSPSEAANSRARASFSSRNNVTGSDDRFCGGACVRVVVIDFELVSLAAMASGAGERKRRRTTKSSVVVFVIPAAIEERRIIF